MGNWCGALPILIFPAGSSELWERRPRGTGTVEVLSGCTRRLRDGLRRSAIPKRQFRLRDAVQSRIRLLPTAFRKRRVITPRGVSDRRLYRPTKGEELITTAGPRGRACKPDIYDLAFTVKERITASPSLRL